MSIIDDDIVNDVTNELFYDPKVDNAAITATARDGRVTLTGTVGSFREKREAKKAAERVLGVISVDNELGVVYTTERTDQEIRDDARQALLLDLVVPTTIRVDVSDGFATLKGTAQWQYQRDEAELVASNIAGVIEVLDEVELTNPKPDAFDVEQSIKDAFKRHANVDAKAVSVMTSNGSVTLEGEVHSWAEHDEAIDAAWAARGVRSSSRQPHRDLLTTRSDARVCAACQSDTPSPPAVCPRLVARWDSRRIAGAAARPECSRRASKRFCAPDARGDACASRRAGSRGPSG